MKTILKAKIHPSEDEETIKEAVKALFPKLEIKIQDEELVGKSNDFDALENLKNKIGLQGITASARRELQKSRRDNQLDFFLNRQAATVHKVSFSGNETPLGPIRVHIESDDIEEVIDYLTGKKKEN